MLYLEKITTLISDLNKMANNPLLIESRDTYGYFFTNNDGRFINICFSQDGRPTHYIVRKSYSHGIDTEQVYSNIYYELMTFILFGIDCIDAGLKDPFGNSINIITIQTLIKKGLPKNV